MKLEEIRKDSSKFVWGKIEKTHEVGSYAFLEYKDGEGNVVFHVFVDGNDTNVGTKDLDEALLYAIARKNEPVVRDAEAICYAAIRLFKGSK